MGVACSVQSMDDENVAEKRKREKKEITMSSIDAYDIIGSTYNGA